jgi:hypothetical protein
MWILLFYLTSHCILLTLMPQVNLSFVLDPNLSFSYEEREIPKVENSRDIVVRVVSTGVCGSDVSLNG